MPWPLLGSRTPKIASLPDDAPRLASGCAPLDALLGGGLERGVLTEVFGEAGAGKTNLCLQLARNVALDGGRVVYLDSEGFSMERLEQVCGGRAAEVRQRLLVERVATAAEQARAVERAVRIVKSVPKIGLVIVDSATLLYRVQLADHDGLRERRAVVRQLHALHGAARRHRVAVVATNQVFSVPGEDRVQGLGGHALRHLAGCVLQLERLPEPAGARRALLVKHRSLPEAGEAVFRLGPAGLEPMTATFVTGVSR